MTAAGGDDRAMTYPSSTTNGLSRRRLILLGAGIAAGAGLVAQRMATALETDVRQAIGQPLRIALPLFIQAGTPGTDTARSPQVALEVTHVIDSNLRRSGRFAPIEPSAYLGKSVAIEAPPDFSDWLHRGPVTASTAI